MRSIAVAVVTLGLSSGLAIPAAAQEVVLRFQHFVSQASANPTHFMLPWAEKIERDSGGRIRVEVYPAMQLGGTPAGMYDLIRDGAIDGGWVIPGYTPGRFPRSEVLELPFMVTKSAEEASRAAWILAQKHMAEDFADVHVIAVHMHGRGLVYNKGPGLSDVADFDGLRLRGPNRPATLLLERLGAVPVGLPVPAFPEALARGVVDGGVITYEQAPSLRLGELTQSHTDVAGEMSLYNLFFLWAMNRDRYESLPPDLRAVIDANSGFHASAWAGRAHDTGDAEGRDALMAAGHEAAVLSDEATARIRELGDEVIAEWVARMTARGIDAEALLSDARAAVQVTRGRD
ncbi:MAG: TRAP transporter substrate-binding protein [Rhodobacteraceae bacterium]|nr:TRAP transporter substrate-binding protein [Paracoccaceae bacterium]